MTDKKMHYFTESDDGSALNPMCGTRGADISLGYYDAELCERCEAVNTGDQP